METNYQTVMIIYGVCQFFTPLEQRNTWVDPSLVQLDGQDLPGPEDLDLKRRSLMTGGPHSLCGPISR